MKFYIRIIALLITAICLPACQETPVKQDRVVESSVKSADGVPIHFTARGNGDTALVFVHCWSCDSSYWQAQMNDFAADYRVVAIDLAGHGQSGTGRKNYTISSFADDVERVVESLDLKKVILVGHSMGGSVIIETALRMPERAIKLVAVDSFETQFQWPPEDKIAEMLAPFKSDFYKTTSQMVKSMFSPNADPAIVQHIANDMASAPSEIGISALSNTLKWVAGDYQNKRSQLKAPLIHINAAQTNRPSATEKIIVVPYVGHFIPQEAPERFDAALKQALAE
ncbi:alpha/beta fold hydrolase [Candidatus Methylobacter oryzae]|uniref:Alpha/beta hydrolase n=1 Tax=Candidatus Methylobacter oryzae TaxID=2497749 RepID=A0ABY3C8K6_9GAMM|nr:alpha/beta hydrolase [Candidatus Methylobacter oryzae]TRW92913.1 alpha/beta hydrolase [Candidatus Methylobacter oryzae]